MGVLSAVAAFFLWGVLPLYWKQIDFLPPASIVAQRTLWSLVVLAMILACGRGWREFRRGLADWRTIGWHLVSGALLAANWLLYVWATLNGRIIEGALGYYLNPFLNMLFGVLCFGERHNRAQQAAIALALCGVVLQIPAVRGFQWVAVILAITFSLYAVAKKRSRLTALHGLTMETLLLWPFALAWLAAHTSSLPQAFGGTPLHALLVIATGLVTTLPLICFGHAAHRIRLTTLGILQFLAPTLQFLIAWLFYHESMSVPRLLSFALIWAAIALYAVDALRGERPQRPDVPL